jgi:hypothetical protein
VHALGRVLTRRLEATPFYRDRVPTLLKRVWVFAFVTFAWIFFRAHTFDDAALIIGRLARFGWSDPRFPLVAAGLVLAVWLYQRLYESDVRRMLRLAPVRVGLVVLMIVWVAVFAAAAEQPFIYFQF